MRETADGSEEGEGGATQEGIHVYPLMSRQPARAASMPYPCAIGSTCGIGFLHRGQAGLSASGGSYTPPRASPAETQRAGSSGEGLLAGRITRRGHADADERASLTQRNLRVPRQRLEHRRSAVAGRGAGVLHRRELERHSGVRPLRTGGSHTPGRRHRRVHQAAAGVHRARRAVPGVHRHRACCWRCSARPTRPARMSTSCS